MPRAASRVCLGWLTGTMIQSPKFSHIPWASSWVKFSGFCGWVNLICRPENVYFEYLQPLYQSMAKTCVRSHDSVSCWKQQLKFSAMAVPVITKNLNHHHSAEACRWGILNPCWMYCSILANIKILWNVKGYNNYFIYNVTCIRLLDEKYKNY